LLKEPKGCAKAATGGEIWIWTLLLLLLLPLLLLLLLLAEIQDRSSAAADFHSDDPKYGIQGCTGGAAEAP
jgi:hypothetical protein